MFIIGLTGGMGSGKTTASHFFEKKNIKVIDADEIGRKFLEDPIIVEKIKDQWGKKLLDVTGCLQREILRKYIFTHTQARVWLENLLHPLIIQSIKDELLKESQQKQSPYVMVSIPLLIEKQAIIDIPFNRILVIDVSESTQIERIAKRSQLSLAEIEAIVKVQLSRHERLKKANDILDNNDTFEALEEHINVLHDQYLLYAKPI